MAERLLILETSQRAGVVALADGDRILGRRTLEEARRHGRDLAPFAHALLAENGWKAQELDGVIVSRGPGSYTGLRVGIISAKTLAYATGCALVAVETFAAIANQAPPEAELLDVAEDAQQGKLYVQRFRREAKGWAPVDALHIVRFEDWANAMVPDLWLAGPAMEIFREKLPAGVKVTLQPTWRPQAESLLALGLSRLRRGERDDPFALEPLYLRPSEAETKWQAR